MFCFFPFVFDQLHFFIFSMLMWPNFERYYEVLVFVIAMYHFILIQIQIYVDSINLYRRQFCKIYFQLTIFLFRLQSFWLKWII